VVQQLLEAVPRAPASVVGTLAEATVFVTTLRRVRLLIAVTSLLVVPACSSATEAVQLTIEAVAAPGDPASGTFTDRGHAVDDGLVCSAGSWANVGFFFGSETANWFEDEMTCDDGTGSFVLRVDGLGIPTNDVPWTGQWAIVTGTGSYADLDGNGSFEADFSGGSGVETYVGEVEDQ
jgi:hypothetical protein